MVSPCCASSSYVPKVIFFLHPSLYATEHRESVVCLSKEYNVMAHLKLAWTPYFQSFWHSSRHSQCCVVILLKGDLFHFTPAKNISFYLSKKIWTLRMAFRNPYELAQTSFPMYVYCFPLLALSSPATASCCPSLCDDLPFQLPVFVLMLSCNVLPLTSAF